VVGGGGGTETAAALSARVTPRGDEGDGSRGGFSAIRVFVVLGSIEKYWVVLRSIKHFDFPTI
jgi:hypothetical protein